MDENDQKERFSLAYISAVAAHAGYQVIDGQPIDKDSIDGEIVSDVGRSPRIEFQAKATAQDVLSEDVLRFPLSIKNYEDLRREVRVPRLLIVVLLPPRQEDWLVHSEEELRLRHCAYWLSLAGWAPTTNTSSVTVPIPRTQVLNTDQLRILMECADRGEALAL